MHLNIRKDRVILLVSLAGIVFLGMSAIASAASVVTTGDFTLGIAWTGMIAGAYEGSILAIMISILGYWGALAAIAMAPPTGGASIAVAL